MTSFDFKVFKGSPSGDIIESTSHRPELTKDEVYLQITHSGACFTDSHFRHYDMVLGHEGVGLVQVVGPEVKALKVGDRVGWGWIHETCGVCEQCIEGQVFYCTGATKQYGTADLDQGSFGNGAVWREQNLFKLPDTLPSDVAAPLMCAGISVWGPLTEYTVKPWDVVGVVGIGGLGHLAIQFANKLGCQVIAFSGTDAKKDEALKLGAHHFVTTKGVKDLQASRKVNHLLVTTSSMVDWDQYKSVLAPRASVFPLMATDMDTKLAVPHMQFLLSGWKLIGSTTSPRIVYRRMLEFAALHGIRPTIERFPLTKQGVEHSLRRLDEGTMRYRGVLYAEGA